MIKNSKQKNLIHYVIFFTLNVFFFHLKADRQNLGRVAAVKVNLAVPRGIQWRQSRLDGQIRAANKTFFQSNHIQRCEKSPGLPAVIKNMPVKRSIVRGLKVECVTISYRCVNFKLKYFCFQLFVT